MSLCFFQKLCVHIDVYKTNRNKQFFGVLSHDVHWENKTYKVKRLEVHYGPRATLELLVRALATQKPHCSISILSEVNFALN